MHENNILNNYEILFKTAFRYKTFGISSKKS